MIDKASEEQLKNSIDIVNIISNYIEIKKAGANFKANCPFHEEKTPSFVISPTKQIFTCFGCSVHGDAIEFVKRYENLSYPEALEKIASIMNFPLVHKEGKKSYKEVRRILDEVQKWYRRNFNSSLIAQKYLRSRGISSQSIDKFGIGYVGKSNELINFLSKNLFSLPKAQEGGLIALRDNGNGYYARLTERITFPIHSPSGAIVGFGGRTIKNHPAKYINSPQTVLFNKSQLLYGYSIAKPNIYREQRVIICEGYLDVILLHQVGFHTAVATLGTALTKEHIPLLRRGEPEIILAYDGDRAGIQAGLKASILLSEEGLYGKIVLFPKGKDPADMVTNGNIKELAKLLGGGESVIEFAIRMMAQSHNLKNPREKERAFDEIKSFLYRLSETIRDDYFNYASKILNIRVELFQKISNKEKINPPPPPPQPISTTSDGKREDVSILTLIKNIYKNEEFRKLIQDIVEPKMFGKEYRELFQDAISNRSSAEIEAILSNKNIRVIELEELKSILSNFIYKFYISKLKSIPTDNSLSLRQKCFLLSKMRRDILPRVEGGELIPYRETKLK